MAYKHFIWAAILGWIAAGPTARAQSASSVRIYTDPPGATFSIDGQNFQSAVNLMWTVNSKHTVTAFDQDHTLPGTGLVYKGWVTNLSPGTTPSTSQPLTASPGLQWIKLVFEASYLLTIQLGDCAVEPCATPGTVEIVGKGIFSRRTQFYVPTDQTVEARAFPGSGYVFTGWAAIYGLPTAPAAFDVTFHMVGPTQLAPMFQPATAVKSQANIVTDPPQLQLLVDRTPYTAPITLDWGWGSVHSLGANPVQVIQGVTYVFDSWSDGGALNHDVTVPSQSGPISLTARFVPATLVAFGTSPAGLSLSIDGRQNWPSYSFAWAPGATHQISAPATQTDSQGHKYRFVSWSNGKPAAFDYTAGPAPGNDHVTATYQPLGQVTINSVPAGLPIQVDGANCDTPCTVEKDAGSTVTITAAAMRENGDQSRFVFQGWSDSTAATRTLTLSADPRVYTANYALQNRLSVAAVPADGASFVLTPPSPDGFYDAGTLVAVTAKLQLGFRITTWSGDISGTAGTVALPLDSPRSATLVLDPVPAIGPLGVRNAAAGASPEGVAPGSLISIFGANLAPDSTSGPASPLVQTLGSVTVRVDDTFLPLIFVSPPQINAQLPAGTPEGAHKITVRWEGKPETTVQILVARNAPGLFSANSQSDQALGIFVRGDGTAVTADNPARVNEVVSILGTGLGPYVLPPPDGFLFDETSGYTLTDHVTVLLGDQVLDVLYAGRSGGGVGVDAVRFQLPATLAGSSPIPVRLQVNGKESNTVFLPVSQQ